jgi:hypothetical protein
MEDFKPIPIEKCEIEIHAEEEQISVRGNALVSGDDAEDKRAEDSILRKLARGNVWAWAFVKVTVSYMGVEGSDTLGCCSYKNEKDFKKGGYYDDMVNAAHAELNEKLKRLYDGLTATWASDH